MELKNCPEVTAMLKDNPEMPWEVYAAWLSNHLETCEHCQSLLVYVKEEEDTNSDIE